VAQSNGQPRKTNRQQGGDQPLPGQQRGQAAPQPVLPSLEVLQAEFEAMVQRNQAQFQALQAQGSPPDPFYLVHARINHLIDSISQFAGPNGPRWAAMTRLGFEQVIAAELDQAEPALRRMQLAEGARYTPSMISALARQTGTLRKPQ
jgi:hypothetical protein